MRRGAELFEEGFDFGAQLGQTLAHARVIAAGGVARRSHRFRLRFRRDFWRGFWLDFWGRFKDVSGTLSIDEARPTRSTVDATIAVASVDTGADQRDEHLRSDDFFNTAQYPQITFRSTGISGQDDDWKMEGDLTIRDITKSVVLDVEFEGRGPDAFGGVRAGFTATTKINRKDFGVNWNGLIEAGGFAVGDAIKITLNIEAVKQN